MQISSLTKVLKSSGVGDVIKNFLRGYQNSWSAKALLGDMVEQLLREASWFGWVAEPRLGLTHRAPHIISN